MRTRRVAPVVLSLILFASPLMAFDRGQVLLENLAHTQGAAEFQLWAHSSEIAAAPDATLLKSHPVPYVGAGHFLLPSANRIVFHHERVVSVWDDLVRTNAAIAATAFGHREIFTADTELGELSPMLASRFLMAERWSEGGVASLIEFDLRGIVSRHPFPTLLDADTNRTLGAVHIELLADQCTLLYTNGADHPQGNRVRSMNICTNEAKPDFATLTPGEYAGAIRQLPNGEVLVANGNAVLQFNAAGSLLRSYYLPGVTHVALDPDGTSFWAAGVSEEEGFLRSFDLSAPGSQRPAVQLGDGEHRSSAVETGDLVVAGEWRAALSKRTRSRAARH